MRSERDKLAAKVQERLGTAKEQRRHLALERQLRRIPTEAKKCTDKANADDARKHPPRNRSWPAEKYGLDRKCWPRLWLVLLDTARNELETARAGSTRRDSRRLGGSVRRWTVWAWWALPAALVIALAGYRLVLGSAAVYSDRPSSAFDVHRRLLYEALRLAATADTGRGAGARRGAHPVSLARLG